MDFLTKNISSCNFYLDVCSPISKFNSHDMQIILINEVT